MEISAEVCIVGLGPAGLGVASELAGTRHASKVVCVEAGVDADKRFCTVLEGGACRRAEPCQITSGVGGAAVLSAGKVSALPAGRALVQILGDESRAVAALDEGLERFKQYVPLQNPDRSKPVIAQAAAEYSKYGFDFRYYDAYRYNRRDLVSGIDAMVSKMRQAGTSVLTESRVQTVEARHGGYDVYLAGPTGESRVRSTSVVIAGGRTAYRLISAVVGKLELGAGWSYPDVGVRLEFPTEIWPEIDRAHNDLKLHFGSSRTFCVCKDGWLAPYRVGDFFLLEGYSEPNERSGFTNLAVTVREPSPTGTQHEPLLDAIGTRLRSRSHGKPVRQRLSDYLKHVRSETRGPRRSVERSSVILYNWGNVEDCFPEAINSHIREAVTYFSQRLLPPSEYNSISVFAAELDYYWPQVQVDRTFQSNRVGLYFVGDAVGRFRGILQAFASGLVAAQSIRDRLDGH